MSAPTTEQLHRDAIGLDARAPLDILSILLAGQTAALRSVESALPQIAQAAQTMALRYRGGGTLIYGAAGSSGLMALADAAELAGTYGTDPARVRFDALCVDAGQHGPRERRDNNLHRQQSGCGDFRPRRHRHLPANAARSDCRVNPHGGGHSAKGDSEHDVDADGRSSGRRP